MSSTFNSRLNSVADQLAPCFSQINYKNWDQTNGSIKGHEFHNNRIKCCIGAHVAKYFDLAYEDYNDRDWDSVYYHFTDGVALIEKMMKLNREQVDLIFKCAGTPANPFGGDRWLHIPIDVLERVRRIETAPPDLLDDSYSTDLVSYYKDVAEWMDKEEANMNKTLLSA